MKEYEMHDSMRSGGVEPMRKATSSALVTEFRRVSQMVQNTNAAEKSRKTSRMTKGLNPDVPRPNKPDYGTHRITQDPLATRRKPSRRKLMRRPLKCPRWTSTAFPWKNCATGSGPTWKLVYSHSLRSHHRTSHQEELGGRRQQTAREEEGTRLAALPQGNHQLVRDHALGGLSPLHCHLHYPA